VSEIKKKCPFCAEYIILEAIKCRYCGERLDLQAKTANNIAIPNNENKKIAAGVLALLLGGIGVHKFYLGYTTQGIIILLCFFFGWILFFIPWIIIGVISLAEGIIYLTKSDEDFHRDYVQNKKPWF